MTKNLMPFQRPCHKNVHVRYESSNIHYIVENNVYLKKFKIECFFTNKIIFSQGIFMENI